MIQSEFCPTHGELCLTFSSRVRATNDVSVPPRDIIMTSSMPINTDLVRFVPIGHVIQLLKENEKRLQRLHVQPGDATLVGVRSHQLELLEVVVARKPSRQARLDTDDLGEETQLERDAAKVLARRLSPLLTQLNEKTLSTEQLCTSLAKEVDPSHARAILVALAGSTEPISDGTEIIYQGTSAPPRKSVHVFGAQVHRVIALVHGVEWGARRAHVQLISTPDPSPIFTSKDLGQRNISVSMQDDLSCWLSTQAMSFNEPLEMKLVIDAHVDSRGISFTAKLIEFPDAGKVTDKFHTMFTDRLASLFD